MIRFLLPEAQTNSKRATWINWYIAVLAIAWTLVIGGIIAYESFDERFHMMEAAKGQARRALDRDMALRKWIAHQGGIYALQEPAVAHVHLPPEVRTQNGEKLAFLNPHAVAHAFQGLMAGESGPRTRIVSLRSPSPLYQPTEWEREALAQLTAGQVEVSSPDSTEQTLRLMRRLPDEEDCRRCHSDYSAAHREAALSVVVPLDTLQHKRWMDSLQIWRNYGGVWLVVLIGIVGGGWRLRRQIRQCQQYRQALGESELRYAEIASAIPGAVYQFIVAPDGAVECPYISEGISRILGLSADEIQKDPTLFFPGALYRQDVEPMRQSLRDSARALTIWTRELRLRNASGDVKWIRATSRPHPLPNGSVLWNGVLLDITDRKHAEDQLQEAHDLLEVRVTKRTAELQSSNEQLRVEVGQRKSAELALRDSENRYRQIVETAGEGIWILDAQQQVVFANRRIGAMLGYDANEMLDRPLADFMAGSIDAISPLSSGMSPEALGQVEQRDMRLRCRDGREVWVMVNRSAVEGPDEQPCGTLWLVADITDRVKAEANARQAQASLLEHQREEKDRVAAELEKVRRELVRHTQLATIGQVSASIAHDLRNPLGVIRNAVFLLKRKVDPEQAKCLHYLDIIQQETAAADKIITGLMAMSRGKLPAKQSVNLIEVIEAARQRSGAPDSVQWLIAGNVEHMQVEADPALLEQVLRNLFVNALQALGGTGTITIEARRENGWDEIGVTDTGPGISDDHRQEIFEPLFTTKAKGTGLGLTICRQIIERHGGSIELANTSQGAGFYVRLPHGEINAPVS